MEKIPCFVCIYEQVDIIKRSLTFLTNHASRLNIIVIENYSDNTNEIIKPYVTDLLDKGLVWKYYLFDENIANNAFHMVIENAIETYLDPIKFPYTFVTDGDLTIEYADWIDEQLAIMENKDIFVCGSTLDMSNLPVKSMPNSVKWVPPAVDCGNYNRGLTGIWLCLFRTNELIETMHYLNKNNLRFLDSHFHKYAKDVKNMIWARTKKTIAYHITWDLYADLNHPYTVAKTKSVSNLWFRNIKGNYQLFEK